MLPATDEEKADVVDYDFVAPLLRHSLSENRNIRYSTSPPPTPSRRPAHVRPRASPPRAPTPHRLRPRAALQPHCLANAGGADRAAGAGEALDRRGIEPREEYALARMARLGGALRVVGGEIADGKLSAAPQDRYHGVQVHEPRGLRRPSSGASRHLLPAKRGEGGRGSLGNSEHFLGRRAHLFGIPWTKWGAWPRQARPIRRGAAKLIAVQPPETIARRGALRQSSAP